MEFTSKTKKKSKAERGTLWREIKRNKVAYIYIAPFYILFSIFGLFPILAGLGISLTRWDGVGKMRFNGIENYKDLLTDSLFWKSMGNTFYIGIISHIFILFGGLILAYMLNAKLVKGENIFKTIYFLPMVTSAVAVTIVFQAMFSYNSGLINYGFSLIGMERVNWLGDMGQYLKPAVIIMFSWKWIGWNMVIYLAGMQGISHDIYEAATIDGASHINIFFRITLPLLRPIIFFTLVQSTIGMMNLFTEPFMLTNDIRGGTGNQALTMMMYLLGKAPYNNNLYGYASAVAYVMTFIIVIVSVINMNTFGKSDEARERARRKKLDKLKQSGGTV